MKTRIISLNEKTKSRQDNLPFRKYPYFCILLDFQITQLVKELLVDFTSGIRKTSEKNQGKCLTLATEDLLEQSVKA